MNSSRSGHSNVVRRWPAGNSDVRQRRGASELLGITAAVAVVATLGGGAWWYLSDSSSGVALDTLVHTVSTDEFVLTVTERGEIKSAEDVEVRCEVKSKNSTGTSIIKLIPEGTKVEKGDFLIQLDDSVLKEEATTQQIAVNTAEALMIEAKNSYDTAVIAMEEYLNATFVQEVKTIESEIFIAEENLSRAQEYLKYSEKLAAKGHITEEQLKADRFAVEKAEKDLEVAQTKLEGLKKYTKAKQIKTLESAIATAKAKWESDKKSYELEVDKLKLVEDQVSKCMVTAPAAGTVVYAHERGRRGDDFIIEEGAVVRERQTMIRLPNSEKMQVELEINEAMVKYVQPGLLAAIQPIGFERPLAGSVTQVNQYAEPDDWRRPNVRAYKSYVRIEESHPNIRSGMTALVTIECQRLNDVIQVPVQTVYAHGKNFYCFISDGNKWKAQEIERGPTNDKYIVVAGGLSKGQRIALAPRTIRDDVKLPKLSAEQQQNVVQSVAVDSVAGGNVDRGPNDGGRGPQTASAARGGRGGQDGPNGQARPAGQGGPRGRRGGPNGQGRPESGGPDREQAVADTQTNQQSQQTPAADGAQTNNGTQAGGGQ